jgi:ABC-type phosphate transport system substrate-binding protein
MSNRYFITVFIWFLIQTPVLARDKLVIVVNSKNPIQQMTRSEVIDLFMGKYVAFPDGKKAIAVDLNSEQTRKKEFYNKLVGRSLASVNAYWSRLRFTGRVRPPIKQASVESIAKYIAATEGAIGYIPESMLNGNLKVVYQLNE